MLDKRLVDIAGAVPAAGLEAAWSGIAEADRVPPPLRTDAPDRGFSRLSSPGQLRTGVRHLYAIRLARRDLDRYRRITRVGLRFVLDTLDAGEFAEYVEWLDDLEGRYPGKLDVLVAAYRAASPPEPSWLPGFDEVVRAYEERAAALDR